MALVEAHEELPAWSLPTGSLDSVAADDVMELLVTTAKAERVGVVVVTHELASIFTIGNNSVFLDAETRTMIAGGDPKELLAHSQNPTVRRFLTRGEEKNP